MSQKMLLLLLLVKSFLIAGEVELEFDLSSPDPLTAAITRGAEKAYEVNIQGLDALEAGDLTLAEQSFKSAMELIPLYSDAQNNLGVVYYRTNRVDSALAIWKSITVTDEEYHLSWYNLGLHAFDQKKFGRAIDLLKKAEKTNKRFAATKFLRAQAYYEMGDIKKVAALLKEAHTIDPKNSDILEYYAVFSFESGDTLLALSLLDGRTEMRAISLKGEILAIQKRYTEALPLLEAVKEEDTTGGVSEVLIDIYLDQGDLTKAMSEIKRVKKSLKNMPVSMWINAAFALSEQGKNREAIKWLNKGYLVEPDDDILYNLGQLHYRQGNYQKAIEFITKLPEAYRDGQSYFVLANAYWKIGDFRGAKEALYSALYYSSEAPYYVMLGRVLLKEGEKEGARIQFQKALSIDSSLEDAKIELALLYEGGSYSELISILEERLEGCRKCYSEMNRLAILYQMNGQWEKGVALIEGGAHKSRELSMTLFYILEKAGKYQDAKKVLQKGQRKGVLTVEDQFVFAQFLSEYNYFKESIELSQIIAKTSSTYNTRCSYLIGYNYMKLRSYKKAAHYLEISMKGDKDNVSTRSALAYVLNELGDDERAEKLWLKSVSDSDSDAVNFINLGLLSYNKGEYKKALSYYEKAMTIERNNQLFINMANCYNSLKDFGKAQSLYTKGIHSPDSVEAYCGIYWTSKKLGEVDNSITEKLMNAPLTNGSRRVFADLSYGNGGYDKAKVYLCAVDSLDGDDYFFLSRITLALKEYKDAERYADSAKTHGVSTEKMRKHLQEIAYESGDLEQAKSLSGGNSVEDLYNKAVLQYETKSYEEFLFFVKEKISLFDGGDELALLGMAANCAVFLKKWDELLYWSKREYELSSSAKAAYNCAVAAYNMSDIETSYHYYKKAQQIDSSIKNKDIEQRYIAQSETRDTTNHVETGLGALDSLFNNAIVIHRKGELDKAENIYKLILQRDDRYYRAWNNLGIIYGERGDIDEAVKCYKSSISKRSDIADGFINLVYLYIAIEEYDKAKKWLKKGLKQHVDNEQLHQFKKQLNKLN